nr:TonB-dependent receptor plug domain-containing protein [Marinicella sp. W31]MDC2877977.1 TonB-dependent receptor plug domain-containing protein [Marinicella sp. W31]
MADTTTVLAPVNVTTTSGKTGIADTPLATETTRDALDANIVTNFDDFTRILEPGVTFVGDDSGSVNIRGMQGPRVSTVIDGIQIPYLDDTARGDANGGMDSFSFDSIATIDIVRGSDSSRSGSGSLGGTVVLRTLEPEDLIDPEKGWGGRTGIMYDSASESINAQGRLRYSRATPRCCFRVISPRAAKRRTRARSEATARHEPKRTRQTSMRIIFCSNSASSLWAPTRSA